MSRVVVVLPSLSGGGAEKVALYLAGGFADKGHETILAIFDAQGALKDQVPPNVELVDFKVTSTVPAMKALRKLIKDRRPDAVNSHQDAVNLAATLVRILPGPNFQLVTTIHHGLSADYGPEAPEYMKKRFKMMQRFSRFADITVGVGPDIRSDAIRLLKVPEAKAVVIQNPVVTPNLGARLAELVDDPWFVPGAPPVVISVGRLHPTKGFTMLLRAWAEIEKRTNARLLILGEGPQREELEALAKELNLDPERFRMPGFVGNPYAYLGKSRLFAFTSVFEGMPLALIEALACGLTVVSTDCEYGPRTILRDGEYGRLVPVNDEEAFAEAAIAALNEPPRPAPPDAWAPYLLGTAVEKYERVLFPQRKET